MKALETIIEENNPRGEHERDYQALTLDNLRHAERNVANAENYSRPTWKQPINKIRTLISSAIEFIRGESW